MSHQFNDELISAYLDGELTAEEQALVERKLSESPEHQQMFDELRALRESFQFLPTYKLDERFGERVLRAAERNMLAGSQLSNAASNQSSSRNELSTPASLSTNDRTSWRMAVGSVAAVAALVLVTLFLANRGDEVTNDPEVSHREEKNASNKTNKHRDESVQEDLLRVEPLAERGGSKRKSGSRVEFDEGVENASSADSYPAPSDVQTERQFQAGATVENSAGESLDRRYSASPRRSDQPTAAAGGGGGFGGDTGNRRAALGGANGIALDAKKSPTADRANGAELFYDEGLLANSIDGVVIIEIARDQREQQPVELALTRLQVRELQPASSHTLKQSLADQTAASDPRSNNGPGRSTFERFQAEGGKAVNPSDEIVVVAMASEITQVCEMLREQGFNARFDGNEVAAAAVAPLLRGRKLQGKLAQQVEGPNQDAKLAEAKKKLNQDNQRDLRPPAPGQEKADADKYAGTAVSPKPAPAAPAGPLKAIKDEEKTPTSLPSPAKTRARPSVTPAGKPKKAGEDGAEPELEKPTGNSDATAGENRLRMKNAQLSRQLVESYRKDVSGSFFYRPLPGPGTEQPAERMDDAKQLDEADSGAATPQHLGKGTASRGVRTAPEDATEKSGRDIAEHEASPLPRLHVRFVIRTIDSSVSGSASEEPASKK